MPDDDTNERAAAAVQQALLRRADELGSAWADRVLDGGPAVDASATPAALPGQASRLVHEVVAGMAGGAPSPTAEPDQARAFAAAALQAGVALPRLLETLDDLTTLLTRAAADDIARRGDVPAADAFAIADRIHCGVRAIAAVAAGVYVDTEPGHAPEEAGERFDSFARTIAHELKNPLGAARGAAELLATGEGTETPESRTRFAELVIRNVNKALDVLDDVRATSQVDARSDVA